MPDLSKKKCVPCSGETPPFSKEQAAQYLKEVNDWSLEGETIKKNFVFENFDMAMLFANQVAEIAREEGHHPDILIHDYKQVTVTLTTHAAHGLTENDFIVAAKIDGIDFAKHS